MKRNRFVRLSGGTRTVNRELEDKARALAGLKGYVTNLRACPDGTPVTPEFVIGAYHQLFQIEKSFRMAKSDLQARPIYHRKRDSIEAHLTIVLAALAVSRWIEHAAAHEAWFLILLGRAADAIAVVENELGRLSRPSTLSQIYQALAENLALAHIAVGRWDDALEVAATALGAVPSWATRTRSSCPVTSSAPTSPRSIAGVAIWSRHGASRVAWKRTPDRIPGPIGHRRSTSSPSSPRSRLPRAIWRSAGWCCPAPGSRRRMAGPRSFRSPP